MHEKIKELALQAGGSHYPNVNSMQLVKFAELIVKECVTISLKNSHREDDMGAIIANQIKKNFGV